MLVRHMPRMKKCIDDVIGWADTMTQLFHDTNNFLYHTSLHGVIQNPSKFIWGRTELEYVGFWLKTDGIRPTDETLRAIQDFPRPSDITGVRS